MDNKTNIGWREWLALPKLNIPAIKAKIDTGAKTSALHTFDLERIRRKGKDIARFKIHPLQKRTDVVINCESEIVDIRNVKDSGGHGEQRFFIETPIEIAGKKCNIEISLTNREDMLFRMLLGRTALKNNHFIVDPAKSYLCGKHIAEKYKNQIKRKIK